MTTTIFTIPNQGNALRRFWIKFYLTSCGWDGTVTTAIGTQWFGRRPIKTSTHPFGITLVLIRVVDELLLEILAGNHSHSHELMYSLQSSTVNQTRFKGAVCRSFGLKFIHFKKYNRNSNKMNNNMCSVTLLVRLAMMNYITRVAPHRRLKCFAAMFLLRTITKSQNCCINNYSLCTNALLRNLREY